MTKKSVIFYVPLILFASATILFADRQLTVPREAAGVRVTNYTDIFEDRTNEMTFDDILSKNPSFLPVQRKWSSLGVSASTFWIRLLLENPFEETYFYYLEFPYPMIDDLEGYHRDPGRSPMDAAMTETRVINMRSIPNPTPLFLIELPPGDHHVYFKVRDESSLKPIPKLWDKETFDRHLVTHQLVFGIFIGIFISVILYNAICFLGQRRWIYLWFSLYGLFVGVLLFFESGTAGQFIRPFSQAHENLSNHLVIITEYLMGISCFLFYSRFQTDTEFYAKTVKTLLTISILIGLVFLIPGFKIKIALVLPCHILSFTILFIVFIRAFYRHRPFYIIITGMACYLLFLYLGLFMDVPPPIIACLSFLIITIGTVIYSNSFNLEQTGLMLSIQQAENVKSEFIHSVAHNLKTPLVALMFSSQMLKSILKDNMEAQHFLDKILRNATWLSNFIENFFEFYKNDKFELNIRNVDMKMLVNSIVGELADINRYRHNILFNQAESDDDFYIHIDKSIVEQVLLNVVENAIKYSTIGDEKGTIIINLEKHPDEFIISVADNGIGISKNSIGKIYDAFFRANRDDQYGGTGLGLTISKKFIDAHQGKIYCISPVPKAHSPYLYLDFERKGTVFFIHLPTNLKKEEEEEK